MKYEMNLPDSAPVEGRPSPYCLVRDEAFRLTEYLLWPYPEKGLTNERQM